MTAEELLKLDEEDQNQILDELEDDEADELMEKLLSVLSDDDNVTGHVYQAGNCFFIISGGSIWEMSDDASDNPRGGWFPDIVTGLSEETKATMTEIIEKAGGMDAVSELFDIITENIDIEFDDEDVIEMFEDEDDAENVKLYRELSRAVKKHPEICERVDEFYAKFRMLDLEEGALYYEWEGEYIDLLDNVAECGECNGTYDELSSQEWLHILVNLKNYMVTPD